MSAESSTLEDVIPQKQEHEVKEKNFHNLDFLNGKAIPYAFELGYLTLSVGANVLEKIKYHWSQNNTACEKVNGICFGEKRDASIYIKECYPLKRSSDGNILIDGSFYNSNLDMISFYSNGEIPDSEDVSFVANTSKKLNQSIFLIKFICSAEIKQISTTIYENVYDISKSSKERVFSVQVYSHPPHEGFIKSNYRDCDSNESDRLYYLMRDWSIVSKVRQEPDVSDEQRVKFEEKVRIFEEKLPKYKDFESQLSEVGKNEGWLCERDFIVSDPMKDYLELTKKFCKSAKLDLRFVFYIPLGGENEKINCYAQFLNFEASGVATTIKGSQNDAAFYFLQQITIDDMRKRSKKIQNGPVTTYLVPGSENAS